MMLRRLAVPAMLLLMVLPLSAQRRRDPLTDAETDQLREVADQPDERLKVWVKFIRARMLALDQLRSDPKFAAERGKRMHDMLEDLTSMVDELDDNVDNYLKQHADVRKSMKQVIEMTSELQVKLREIKDLAAGDPNFAKDARDYKFVLENAFDSVNQSAASSRDALQDLNEYFAKKKEEEKKKKK